MRVTRCTFVPAAIGDRRESLCAGERFPVVMRSLIAVTLILASSVHAQSHIARHADAADPIERRIITAGDVGLLVYTFDDGVSPTANAGLLGSEYDGLVGAGIEFVEFNEGNAVEFDDVTDDRVVVQGDQSVFNLADGDFSLVATVVTSNVEPDEPGGRFVINKEKLGSDDGWAMTVRRATGEALMAISDGSTSIAVVSKTPVNDGDPHEIVACRRDDQLIMAVDGVVEAVVDIPGTFGSTTDNAMGVSIGGRAIGKDGPTVGPNDEFLGLIDSVQIFDVALLSPCLADVNGDGVLNILDFVAFQERFVNQDPVADCDGNGQFNILDFVCFQTLFEAGCS